MGPGARCLAKLVTLCRVDRKNGPNYGWAQKRASRAGRAIQVEASWLLNAPFGGLPPCDTSPRLYDEKGHAVTVRENIHQLVDKLPEDRLEDVLDYLADLKDGDEATSAATAAAIEEGLDDIRHSRTISLEEYSRARGLRTTRSGFQSLRPGSGPP